MAQLVLGAVGAVIGFYVGGPAGALKGAQIGFAVGSVYEAATADDVTTFGPRLGDRSIQSSTYGANIPFAYGSVRVAGNVIWAAPLEEVETATEVGGKGGPTQTSVTYSYFASFATLLAHGPQRGVRRIWADAVLIYDGTLSGNIPSEFAFTFYPGSETQTADPTIEAAEGVGNTPAYRGSAYLVFTRMPLERFGNRIPSISVEMLGDGEWSADVTEVGDTGAYAYDAAVQRLNGEVVAVSEPSAGTTRFTRIDPATGGILGINDVPFGYDSSFVALSPSAFTYVPPTDQVWLTQDGDVVIFYDAEHFTPVGEINLLTNLGWNDSISAYEPTSRTVVLHRASSQVGGDRVSVIDLNGALGGSSTGILFARQLVTGGSSIFLACSSGIFGAYTIPFTDEFAVLQSPALSATDSTAGGSVIGLWDPRRRRYVVFGRVGSAGAVWTVSDANPPVISVTTPAGMFATSAPSSARYNPELDAYVVMTLSGNVTMSVIDAETLELARPDTTISGVGFTEVFASPISSGTLFNVGSTGSYEILLFGTTVGAVVRHLATWSEILTEADIDVSDLTQRLRGYVVAQPGPVRAAIGQLATVYAFGAVEEDDVVVFRRRASVPAATITREECGAGVDEHAAIAVETTRAQELDLPRRLYLTAPDPGMDHQPGTQYAERQTRQAGDDETISVAVELTPTECLQTAQMLMFDRWASRDVIPFVTTREYARLVPTDVATVDGRRMRIISKTDEGGLIRFEAVSDDADVLDQVSVGVGPDWIGQEIAVQVPTNLTVLDIALLRDAEDHPGAYIAAYGIAPQWRGGVVYTSADDEATWSRVAVVPRPGSAIGSAVNALGTFTGGNVFDEHSSLSIALSNGSATGTTRLGVLNGGNALALASGDDWEILQYRDVVLEDDGTYTLTGLLRGRRGTEYAMTGHAAGDRVVLLDTASIRDYEIDSSVIGLARPYRAVSVGDTISSTPSQSETITAERLYPWAPVLLGGGRNASLDVTLRWVRRTRVGGEWRDSVDASLGESSEEYTVRIYSSAAYATVVRTIGALTSPTTTYTAAQQTSDFGSTQSRVYWDVRQSSATVGLGHAARGAT